MFKWAAVAGTGDVTASANMTDNTIIRGDGGGKGVQDSGINIDDSNNVSGSASITMGAGGGLRTDTTATNTLLLLEKGRKAPGFIHGEYVKTTSGVNAIKFALSSGNIASGIIALYGINKGAFLY